MTKRSATRGGAPCALRRARHLVPAVLAAAALGAGIPSAQSAPGNPFDPSWAYVAPQRVIELEYDDALTSVQNGARLRAEVDALVAGDRLEVGAGTYSMKKPFVVNEHGTPNKPIWIVAKEGESVVITRPDPWENLLAVGFSNAGGASYLVFQGFEFTGGSTGVRFNECSNVWIDRCHIHDIGEFGIAANTRDTDHLYITRNHVHDTGGYGEGMYLGANGGQVVMRDSVIALNHVHDTYGWQGDGIEVKQGSYGNWIVRNHVHDCNYPCLLVYGTDGEAPNVIEGNVLYNSNDNVLQVQGDAVVRNNFMMSGVHAMHTHDHQGPVQNLVVVHNTLVNVKRAADLQNWKDRPGMVFANNAVYSQIGNSIKFTHGSKGVTVAGNVVHGLVSGVQTGYVVGNGMADFEGLTWDGSERNALPHRSGALAGAGDAAFDVGEDLNGATRDRPPSAGAYAVGSYGTHYGYSLEGYLGEAPRIGVNSPPVLGNRLFTVELAGAAPQADVWITLGVESTEIPFAEGFLLNDYAWFALRRTSAKGTCRLPLALPFDPLLDGVPVYFQWVVSDAAGPDGFALTDGLEVELSALGS